MSAWGQGIKRHADKMSAYIVDKNHIRFLVEAANSWRLATYNDLNFRWFWRDEWHELRYGESERAAEVANMLWLENIRSVSHRYPNESSATLPGPKHQDFVLAPGDFGQVIFDQYEPAQVLKSCDCYEYQTCEHDEWEESEAYAFIQALRHRAWHAVQGYEQAQWGAPKTIAERRAEYRSARQVA